MIIKGFAFDEPQDLLRAEAFEFISEILDQLEKRGELTLDNVRKVGDQMRQSEAHPTLRWFAGYLMATAGEVRCDTTTTPPH